MSDYLSRLLKAHAQGAFQPGTVTVISVVHEDGCKRPDGGPCTCQPDMTSDGDSGRHGIDLAGNPNQGGNA